MAARRDDQRGRAKRPSAAAAASSSNTTTPAASPTTKTGTTNSGSSSSGGGGRMDLMLAAAASADSFHPPPPPPPPVAYHQFAPYPPSDVAASTSKHKRAKKSDGDEWAAAGSGGMRISSLVGPPIAQHSISSLTAPTSSAASLASILSAASPIPVATAPSPTASVFQAPPAPVPSFAEAERRRAAAANGPQPNGKSAAIITGSSGGRGLGSGAKSSGAGPLSMLELFFPVDAASAAAASDASGSRDPAASKSLKRKRRGDSTQPTGAAAAEYDLLRFGVDASKLVPQGLVDRVDAKMDRAFIATLIRSHVAHWGARAGFGSRFLAELAPLLTAYYPCHYPTILDHVLASFLFKRPEFTELLLKPMIEKLQKLGDSATGAKYPVVDAFARTCYYLHYQEAAATTATTAAGMNQSDEGGAGAMAASATERARHDFACETLLQCLLESNTDKFILSPAIAACAAHCSDAVLERLWRQIVGAWLAAENKSSGKSSVGMKNEDTKAASEAQDVKSKRKHTSKATTVHATITWSITDPLHQAFELLAEEQKLPPSLLRSRGGDSQHLHQPLSSGGGRASCRLASALVRLVLLTAPLKSDATLLSSSLVRQALEAAWGRGSTLDSSALLFDRLSVDNSDNEFAQLLHSLVHAASGTTLSVRRTNWFARHVLRFLLSAAAVPERKRRLAEIAKRYMPLLLGSTARDDDQGGHAAAHKTTQESANTSSTRTYEDHQGVATHPRRSWETMEVGEMLTVPEIVEKVVFVLEMLDASPPGHAADFLREWTTAWTSKASGASIVPWGYVHAAVLAAVDEDAMGKLRYVRQLFQTLAAQTCWRHFLQLRALPAVERSHARQAEIAKRLSTVLDVLLSASPSEFARSLLCDVVSEIRQFEDSSGAAASVFKNAVMVCLGEGKRSEAWSPLSSSSPTKRGSNSQKALDAATSLSSTHRSPRIEVELRVLASLLHLASLDDEVGRFARSQLSSRPIVRLLTGLMTDVAGNRFKMAKLVDLLDAVVSRQDHNEALGSEWTRQHIVQQFVATAYSVGVPTISDRLVGLVQTLAHRTEKQSGGAGASRNSTLWVTLRQCTRLCCGCRNGARDSRSLDHCHVSAAGNFAELVKVQLCSSAHLSPSNGSETQSVMGFVQQELASCRANESRLNLFLLLVLQKVAAVERQPRSCLSAVQLAVFSISATTRDHIRILQLQVLKALCSRLARIRSRRLAVAATGGRWRTEDADDCRQCEELVCNERLQCDLRRIVDAEGISASSSRASVVLAQSVLKFAAEVGHLRQPQFRIATR